MWWRLGFGETQPPRELGPPVLGRARIGGLAGLATLLTNALPIAAGMIVFAEPLPGGWIGAIRIVAFAAVIAGAVLLPALAKAAAPEAEVEQLDLAATPV